jgi:hypothetical protein
MNDEPIILSRCCPTCDSLAAENAALKAQLAYAASTGDECAVEGEALSKDAERYRWLRGSTKRVVQTHMEACVRRERLQCSDQNAIDAAIDAAMEQSHE